MPSKDEIEHSVRGFLSRNQKINAIKYVRETLGWSLFTSKNFVDMLTDQKRKTEFDKVTGCCHANCAHQTPPNYGLHPRTRMTGGVSHGDLFFACDEHASIYVSPAYSNPENDYTKTPVLTFWSGGCLETVDGKNAICTTCDKPSGHHQSDFPHPCSGGKTKHDCFTHPLFDKNPGKLPQQEKQMPTRQYGTNQKMTAKFPGKCWLCSKQIVEGTDIILPLLSELTPRARHPWVHEKCYLADAQGIGVSGISAPKASYDEQDGDTPLAAPSKWLVDPPPVSQRQRNVIAQNLEAILKALANNPGQTFALVPVMETPHIDAVAVTLPTKVTV